MGRSDVHRGPRLRLRARDPLAVCAHHVDHRRHRAPRLRRPSLDPRALPRAAGGAAARADPGPHRHGDRLDDHAGPRAARDRGPDDPAHPPHAGRGRAARRAARDGARLAVVVGVPLSRPRRRHRQRAAPARRPRGRARSRGARRHPLVLGAASRRQARRRPRPPQPHRAHARASRRALGTVRGVLRRLARQHGPAGDRAGLRGVRRLGGAAEGGAGGAGRSRRRGQGDLREERVRRLPHDRRRVGRRAGAEPQPLRRPHHARGRHVAEHAGQRRGVGARPAAAQGGREDAGPRPDGRAGEGRRRVSDGTEVMAIPHALRQHELVHAGEGTGVWSWVTTVDHKRIGILYGVTAFAFLVIGGIEALIIRLQLARPHGAVVGAETFNALFTMHGTTMVFLAIMPLNAAFFNYMIPLMIGARDVAFPRLNALSYWVFLLGGLFLNASWLVGTPPDAGWFGYANLTSTQFSPGLGVDFWMLAIQVLGVSSMLAGVNFILLLPAMGIVSEVVPVFARKPLFGAPVVIYSGILIGFFGFGVWSHHMFAAGMGPVADSAFAISTMIIAIPTGVKIFNWLATLWGGSIRGTTALHFAVGLIATFTIGGLSGIMHSSPPLDLQPTGTYFLVAHLHYLLIGGQLFGLLARAHYSWPKIH